MITATTPTIAERPIVQTLGVVAGETILGAHIFKDLFAGIRNVVGGRANAYENTLREARDIAHQEMVDNAKKLGADAVVGVDYDYETMGADNGMLMVAASGTAVKLG
ncbi:MAG: heavy metal-binding domain-containing protein [Caulobacter sp.]|jgi:uncharacterized protein YbjQ (UPF0145 family)|nr:heavy metal-binding domain-containing protein [Caulobacter sp.]